MANKTVRFNTKIINDSKVYLKVSDVAKALGYSKQQDFINEHSSLVEKISGVQCVRETDYNNLLSENETALQKQGQIEVTKIETLRNKVNSVLDFQPLKMLFARDFLQMMADRTGCKSKEEYVLTHEIPEEKRKAVQELMQDDKANSGYRSMIEYLQDKERFDIEKIRKYGLDVQFLIAIDCIGHIRIDSYIVGQGVFCNFTDLEDCNCWNDMYFDDNGDVILPYCDYFGSQVDERLINLSKLDIDRDFRNYNVVENMIWCMQNLDVDVLEDYEYEVIGYHGDTIDFSMPVELLLKLILPKTISTIFTDKIIDVEKDLYVTDFDEDKVFEEDFKN